MKTTWNQLSRPLRLSIAAPWCLLAALLGIAATPATRALLLDAAGKPTADVSLASSHWTGTLDAARLPAFDLGNITAGTLPDARLTGNVALFDGSQNLAVPGNLPVGGAVSANVVQAGQFTMNGQAVVDSNKNGYFNNLYVAGLDMSSYIDGAVTFALINGDNAEFHSVTVDYNLVVDNEVNIAGGLGVWGMSGPSSQPPAPTNQAETNALLRAYGLCQ